ncbi:MAG: hypothetical protein JKX85_14400, partial [Phycisphaeraceae bacterium]|nr:hypothetical protein [Phycisphaeraceae bacterium]
VMAIAFLPIAGNVLLGSGDVYPWAAPHEHHAPAHATLEHQADAATLDDGHAASNDSLSAHDDYAPDEKTNHADATHATPVTDIATEHDSMPAVDLTHASQTPGAIDAHTEQIYTAKKAAYLNAPFFIVRWIVFFAIWIGLSYTFWRKSVEQDSSGDPALTRQLERLSPLAIVLFAPTVTFASFDLIMSLSPAWFSTIFGVYYFSGAMIAIFATMILVLAILKNKGLIDDKAVNTEHFHDHGKFLFGFVIFWAYIAFSQYMLIWYASLPETTFWFVARGATTVSADFNAWSIVSIALVIGHFFIPFLGLISRHIKRNNTLLVCWAIYLLVFHWVDLWWLVMPELSTQLKFGVIELGCLLGLGGLFTGAAIWIGSLNAIVPLHDPRLGESLAFKNM